MQHLFKVAPNNYGCARNGYSKDQIYRILKDGFDVPETVYYSNALLEIMAAIGDVIQRKINQGPAWLIPKQLSQENLYFYRNLHLFSKLIYPYTGYHHWLIFFQNMRCFCGVEDEDGDPVGNRNLSTDAPSPKQPSIRVSAVPRHFNNLCHTASLKNLLDIDFVKRNGLNVR